MPSISARHTVLSVGDDAELLGLRELVLRREGFQVITTSDEKEAIAHMRKGACGTLLVCHSLDESIRNRIMQQYRKHCPKSRIIGISNVAWPKPQSVDAVVFGVEGPESLIAAIRGTLRD